MSMPPTVIKAVDTPLRQYRWGFSATFDDKVHAPFTAAAGQLTPHLGPNNGFGGQVLTFCDAMVNLRARIEFTGFSSEARIHFDHYAGKKVDGQLVADTGTAYYFVHDPLQPEKDGYFLYRSPHQPLSPEDGNYYFSIPMHDPMEPLPDPSRAHDLFF